ncbi:short-chain dehydrogenase [Corallococcus sp. H22C18031201]|uniref:SDR family oxidoreductase n=1 Tax=Citreicoccus inhibens TaxID=2849499 RepID=UPI000E75B643|nr:SDR family oxidoreductase [Citreicoccus inhibens]MBU8897165.1 SDR family NAD(P)-dependent oxidoreductase [Citreicoccus inhibens]RJS21264.1 short-chain dehydrogenase [Corallococcus sp. H22C18031201]
MKPLEGRIALVAGATRGAGRGIATMLGEAGATVYCTGRSVRGNLASGPKRPETLEETAERVTALGGKGIAVRVDHSVEEEVEALAQRIRAEAGHLDVLVNDIWGGESLMELGLPFWKQSAQKARLMFDRAIFTHLLTSRHLVPMMVERNQGLIVEVTDGDSFGYRGAVAYDVTKMAVIRLAFAMSRDLRRTNVTALAITPGFLRSEEMLDYFGVTEATWRDAAKKDPNFIASETPAYVGRAVAALAADPNVRARAGRVVASWTLAREYGFTDLDGTQPHWADHFTRTYQQPYTVAQDAAYASWMNGAIEVIVPDWPQY